MADNSPILGHMLDENRAISLTLHRLSTILNNSIVQSANPLIKDFFEASS